MGSEYGAYVFNFGHAGVATCTDMIGVTYTEVGNFGSIDLQQKLHRKLFQADGIWSRSFQLRT